MAQGQVTGIRKYAGSTGFVWDRNENIKEVVALVSIRATKEDFQGCGVIGALVRKPCGTYLVQITKQMAIGGRQVFVEKTEGYTDVRSAYDWMTSQMRKVFNTTVGQKFTVDILGEAVS